MDLNDVLEEIRIEAEKEGSCILEEPDELHIPIDVYGGNYDDCYWGGRSDGVIRFCRNIISKYYNEE